MSEGLDIHKGCLIPLACFGGGVLVWGAAAGILAWTIQGGWGFWVSQGFME